MTHRLMLVATEDWYLWSHRIGLAVAARDAGYEVAIATRVGEYGERIRALGFNLVEVDFARGLLSPTANLRTVRDLCAAYRRWEPSLVHHGRHPADRARLCGCRQSAGAGDGQRSDGAGHSVDFTKHESPSGQAGPSFGARLGHAAFRFAGDGPESGERAVRRIPPECDRIVLHSYAGQGWTFSGSGRNRNRAARSG